MARILLADDSTHAQRMGAKILTAEGHQVSTVSNGQAAIQALEKSVPDLVVADVFMPGRNGYEVCHFVKTDAKLKGVPVLLIIGAMEPYDPEEGRRSGADGLITKPLESSNLLNTVKDLLNSSKRFAPARAVVERETTSGKVVLETSGGTPVEEAPQWEEQPEEEVITTPAPERFEIPKEMNEQPIGMLSGMLDDVEPAVPPLPQPEAPLDSPAVPAAPMDAADVSDHGVADPDGLLSDPGLPPQLDIAEKTLWTAEPAALTPEEEKLFEQPAANWGDLEQLVEQSAAAPASPPPLPWQIPAEPPSDLELTAEAPQPEFVPDSLLEAPLAEIPAHDIQDALLQVAEKTEAQTGTESELESYENLTDTVRAQGPIRTMAAPEPPAPDPSSDPASTDPEPAPSEEVSATDSAPPQPPSFSGPVEELEAAPTERNVSPEDAAAETDPPAVDPATLEHIIRGVVGELMPQIIAQVKQALKS